MNFFYKFNLLIAFAFAFTANAQFLANGNTACNRTESNVFLEASNYFEDVTINKSIAFITENAKVTAKNIKPNTPTPPKTSETTNYSDDTNLSTSSFFTSTIFYIDKGAVISLQLQNIVLENDITGQGTLHLSNQAVINIKATKNITVNTILVENTQLSLKNELQLSGKLHLNNATIALNNYNLYTLQNIILTNNSSLIYNGTGSWINLEIQEIPSAPLSSQNNITFNTNTASYAFIKTVLPRSPLKKVVPFYTKSLFKSKLLQVSTPPPIDC